MSCKICEIDLNQPCSRDKPEQIGPCIRAQKLLALAGEFEREFWKSQRMTRSGQSISDRFFF